MLARAACRIVLFCLLTAGSLAAAADAIATFKTSGASLVIDATGAISSLKSIPGNREFIAAGQPSPLLSVRIDGSIVPATRARWDPIARRVSLEHGDSGVTSVVGATVAPTHVAFEVISIEPRARAELVVWGPYPTVIRETIGEIVGVVRDADSAVGIQSLNPRTLGGFPAQESDIESEWSGDDHGIYINTEFPTELRKGQGYRGDTARATPFGSVLQAFCRERASDRVIANWGHDKFVAPAFADGGVVGSRIALFAVPATDALATLGAIEVAERLPHPVLDGVWAKESTRASDSYLIVDFGEETIDRAVEMTRRAGLCYLYHSSPFETWGTFRLKPKLFPNGWSGLKKCVAKAEAVGIHVGVHTLSNFITPNDPLVSPTPDPRLARVGTSELSSDAGVDATELVVAAADYFRKSTTLDTVVIGDELVRYASVSEAAPWTLRGCQRGAWGSRASAHPKGAAVGRLMDHGYKTFLGNAGLSREIAGNIARLCNETGIRQLSFDGLEGAWATGMGQYGRTLFTESWFAALAPASRGGVINDASNPGHFNWHINTRMNWGEPWYAGFRESQTLYRFKNQVLFERNLMPHMLGWFALRPDTSIEDAEWLLARAAGFHAGFALAASLASTAQLAADPSSSEAMRDFGASPQILEAVRQWETARMSGAFSPATRALLRDNAREFHLEPNGPGNWNLFEIHAERFAETNGAPQAARATHEFVNPHASRPLQWVIRNGGKEPAAGWEISIDGKPVLRLGKRAVPAGGAIRYSGGSDAVLCDSVWKIVGRVPVDVAAATVGTGPHRLSAVSDVVPGSVVKIEVRTAGPATPVLAPLPIGKRIVAAARAQIGVTTEYDPKYRKLAYPGGDVPKETGVCTDVVIRALRGVGIDLQKDVHEDMDANFAKYPTKWKRTSPDANIDHRRVLNLMRYFERREIVATGNPKSAESYRPGDIVAWDLGRGILHIGVVSDTTAKGIPRIIHNIGRGAREEDILLEYTVVGHYRLKERAEKP